MKAALRLELFADDVRSMVRMYKAILPKAVHDTIDPKLPSPWVAEIAGTHPLYRFKRQFLRPKKDYTEANSVGSRGIYLWYTLETGKVYEINEQASWRRWDRRFELVRNDGSRQRLSEDEVHEWLSGRWA